MQDVYVPKAGFCSSLSCYGIFNLVIWWVRNDAYWNFKVVHPHITAYRIQRDIVNISYSVLPKKISRKDREWLRRLALDV